MRNTTDRVILIMIFNIIVGFIIPWVFGIYLYFKDRKTLLTIVPLGAAIALFYNAIGFYVPFWKINDLSLGRISALPFDLGAYPILLSYLIYFIKSNKTKDYKLILLFSILTTVGEFIGVLMGRVIYLNSWNLGWTFVSYLIPYITGYVYYRQLKRENLT